MKAVFRLYRNAFGGLSEPAWMLSLVMLINRSGAMVLPFLGLYLTEELHFSLQDTGIIISVYGIGAVCGALLGGWLTDRTGHFYVQFISLTLGGLLYFVLLHLHQFEYLVAGVFILSLVNDSMRPANAASIASYAKPENVTRAFSLNRMAINLGFSIGPAIGGLLAAVSYDLLFMADGTTCIIAGLFFFLYFRRRQGIQPQPVQHQEAKPALPGSPYKDPVFVLFIVLCCCYAIVFFQLISTLPLYYRQVYKLSELQIGSLMALNGLIVFLLEMLVVYLLGDRLRKAVLIAAGVVLLSISFILLNLVQHIAILFVSMFLLSVSEILAMPFMATITTERSTVFNRGAYMGLYTIGYAVAHVLAPLLGTTIIAAYSFGTLWWASGAMALVTAAAIYIVVQRIETARLQEQAAVPPALEEAVVG